MKIIVQYCVDYIYDYFQRLLNVNFTQIYSVQSISIYNAVVHDTNYSSS